MPSISSTLTVNGIMQTRLWTIQKKNIINIFLTVTIYGGKNLADRMKTLVRITCAHAFQNSKKVTPIRIIFTGIEMEIFIVQSTKDAEIIIVILEVA